MTVKVYVRVMDGGLKTKMCYVSVCVFTTDNSVYHLHISELVLCRQYLIYYYYYYDINLVKPKANHNTTYTCFIVWLPLGPSHKRIKKCIFHHILNERHYRVNDVM